MGDSSPQLNRVQSSASSSDSKPSSSPSPSQPPSQVKSPPKKKKPPTYYHSSTLWVAGVGGGTAILDRRYNNPRPKESGTPVHRAQAQHGQHGRTHSLSSTSLTHSSTNTSSMVGATSSRDDSFRHPYAFRHGRRYLADPSARYPLPVDLPELNRQVLRTMLLVNVFGRPLLTPQFRNKPPKKVLETGCGNGYWSALCHRHFAQQGHSVSFTGTDIAPLVPENNVDGMKWRFVQHDIRKVPMPFKDEEFDFIMVRDSSLVTSALDMMSLIDEYLRILSPGGSIEFWNGDHAIRMLLSHNPSPTAQDSNSEDEKEAQAEVTGTYLINTQTPFTETQNPYLTDYNTWLTKVLNGRGLDAMPCTSMSTILLQEPDLFEFGSRRLAIPLGEVRWERNGAESSLKGKEAAAGGKKVLTTGQAAIRQTALLTVVQFIESMEPFLRDASGKSQNEWNRWYGEMMQDLLAQDGTSWGECLEVAVGWATKRTPPPKKARPTPSLERSVVVENPAAYPPDPHPGNEWKIPKMDLL